MDDHSRTIIHIDIDCFYAQVEMNKQPSLRAQPLGIQQKNIVVTSNYMAREFGLKKCMPISEAKQLCPRLVLVKGEDLYDYRQASNNVSELLREYSELVERLGLDENFVDVTELVNKKLPSINSDLKPVGYIFGDSYTVPCDCGCKERIIIGTKIAQQMRDQIFEKLQLTTCAGVAHNKLLAKIVGAKNKPNKQTFLFPNNACELMLSLEHVKNIPWVGNVTTELLSKININTVKDLQNTDSTRLAKLLNLEKAVHLINLSFGMDETPVKKYGKSQSIGLEDACKGLMTEKDVKHKLKELLTRLLILVKEDGRIPGVLKVTVRKFEKSHPLGGIRETKQCNINFSLSREQQIINEAMILFRKAVDKSKPYKITLLGLSFSKFTNKPCEKNTLVSFLSKDTKTEKSLPVSKQESPKSITHFNKALVLGSEPKHAKFSDSLCVPELYSAGPDKIATDCLSEVKYPPDVDKEVFKELPPDLQTELWNEYLNEKCRLEQLQMQRSVKKPKINTIFNYMKVEPKK